MKATPPTRHDSRCCTLNNCWTQKLWQGVRSLGLKHCHYTNSARQVQTKLLLSIDMWMCQIKHKFSPTKLRCWFRYVGNVFSFHCTKYDVNRWLNAKLFKQRDVTALKRQHVYSALLWHTVYCCVIQQWVTSDGSNGTQNDPGHPENEWEWLSRRLGGPQGLK